jgi:hypothetical protein
MAKVTKTSRGYEFTDLSAVGMRLVNEFQRHHPQLCEPTSQPRYRYILLGSLEHNVLLEKLAADVNARDPETEP